jgi:cleavage and polyadenylation specificity factor subunit 1
MVTLNEHFLFLGSRLANSLLVHYSEEKRIRNDDNDDDKFTEPTSKRRKGDAGQVYKVDMNAEQADDDFLLALDEDNDERQDGDMNGLLTTEETEDNLVSYNFRVHDLFMNIGPAVSTVVIDTTKHQSQYVNRKIVNNNNLEIVQCAGHGKNGCLSLLQRSIRPEINTTTTLSFEVRQMWTLKLEHLGYDSFLIFSVDMKGESSKSKWTEGTKVMRVASNLSEVTADRDFEFVTTEHTLTIESVLQSTRIIQVCLKSITYLDNRLNEKQPSIRNKQTLKFDKEIRSAIIRENYTLVHFKDGSVTIFEAKSDKLEQITTIGTTLSKFGKITAATLYQNTALDTNMFSVNNSKSTYFAVVAWSSGVLEMYSIPDGVSAWTFIQFSEKHKTMFDQSVSEISDYTDSIQDDVVKTNIRYPYVTELHLSGIGRKGEAPHLIALLSDKSLFAYRGFSYVSKNQTAGRLNNLRFTRAKHDELLPLISDDKTEKLDLDNADIFGRSGIHLSKFLPFENIGNMGGVFVRGEQPLWILTERGDLRIHPMAQDGRIDAFTSFHSERCGHGFNYVCHKDNFKNCQLLVGDLVRYNCYWPTRKIPLLSTPHLAAYHHESQCVLVSTSTLTRVTLTDDMEPLPDEGRYPPATERKYTVRLFSSMSNWKELDSQDLLPHEQVLSMKTVQLAKEEAPSDDEEDEYGLNEEPVVDIRDKELIAFVAVGTGFVEGEDQMSKGRIILFDLESRLSSGNSNLYDLREVAAKDVKGSVSCLDQLEGYLAVSMGPKLYVYYFDWKSKQLFPASFYDAQFYVASMNAIKGYLLYGDIYKSVHLLRWRERGHRLSLLAEDYNYLHVWRTEYMVYQKSLGLVVADKDKNVQIFAYTPQRGGKKLVPCADFHVGAFINTMLRLKSRISPEEERSSSTRERIAMRDRQFILFGTVDGAIGYFAPIAEDMYRRLYALQTKMYTHIEHTAGLHPKAFRLFKQPIRAEHNYKKNIVDGQLLWKFIHLDTRTQKTLAEESGTSVQQILRNMKYLHQSTFYF